MWAWKIHTFQNDSVTTKDQLLQTDILTIHMVQEDTLNGSQIANTSLQVDSTQFFTLQVVTKTPDYKEGFRALPIDDVGNEYYVSTFCDLGGYCQIAIATTTSGTTKVTHLYCVQTSFSFQLDLKGAKYNYYIIVSTVIWILFIYVILHLKISSKRKRNRTRHVVHTSNIG